MILNIANKKLKVLSFFYPFFIALFLAVFDNTALWKELFKIKGGVSFVTLNYYLPFFLFFLLVYTAFFILVRFKYVFKVTTVVILLTASIAAYFMDAYGVMLDTNMIHNALETDVAETIELITPKFIVYFFLLGILPSILIAIIPVTYKPFIKQVQDNFFKIFILFVLMAAILVVYFGDYAPLYRSNRHIRHLINPVNFVKSTINNVKRLIRSDNKMKLIGMDAIIDSSEKNQSQKTLTVLVVGETARAKNFSLYGYSRSTNPVLSQKDIIFFDNFYSCGTATATSVPCMFSLLTHENYDDTQAKQMEGLLDVLKHAGVNVLWRNNNSGCKGVCDRVDYENMAFLKDSGLCNGSGCYDEILLKGLQKYVNSIDKDTLIVLHQKGSHGPSYYLRVPKQFEKFKPICQTSQVNECSPESLVNAYDNTILYSDYFLGRVIDFLKNNSKKFNTGMIYVSDHGESLGENNIYLHGLPYFLAPDEQIHVPFVLWLSAGLAENLEIDWECLKNESKGRFSHDNLFHSILGLMKINTEVYNSKMNLFWPCQSQNIVHLSHQN